MVELNTGYGLGQKDKRELDACVVVLFPTSFSFSFITSLTRFAVLQYSLQFVSLYQNKLNDYIYLFVTPRAFTYRNQVKLQPIIRPEAGIGGVEKSLGWWPKALITFFLELLHRGGEALL